jgi:hypothetical protein
MTFVGCASLREVRISNTISLTVTTSKRFTVKKVRYLQLQQVRDLQSQQVRDLQYRRFFWPMILLTVCFYRSGNHEFVMRGYVGAALF